MKKTKLFKSLLVAAGLCVGASNVTTFAQDVWSFSNTGVWGNMTSKGKSTNYKEISTGSEVWFASDGTTATSATSNVSFVFSAGEGNAEGARFNFGGTNYLGIQKNYDSTNDINYVKVVVPDKYRVNIEVHTGSSGRPMKVNLDGTETSYTADATYDYTNTTGNTQTIKVYATNAKGGDWKTNSVKSITMINTATAASYSWTANAVATIGGTETTIKTYSSETDVMQGADYTVVVDKAIKYGDKYYVLNDDAFASNVYGKTYTMGNAAATHNYNYEVVESAVFYGEAEAIVSANKNGAEESGTYFSNGKGYVCQASSGYVTLTFNVPETAVYKLTLGMNNNNSRERGFNYSIDGANLSETITVGANSPYVQEITGQTLNIGTHTITMNITYSRTPSFDYLLVEKTGEATKQTYSANFYDDNNWEHVYAYAYRTADDHVEYFGAWPGKEIITKTDNKYTVSFEAALAPTTIIFHNNDGTQTANLVFEDGGNYNLKGKIYTTTATFTTNLGWEHVYAYVWSGDGASKEEQLGGWAGRELTATDGVYTASIFSNTIPEFIIFHNNAGAQTSNLAFEDGKAYTWNNYTVYFTTTEWSNVNAWAWNIVGEGTENLSGSWPGTAMTGSEGTYTYTYTGVKAPDMILFNNGTNQTNDFTFEDGKTYTAAGPTSVDKTISAAGYATYCSPYALDFTGSNLTAYIAAKDADNNVTFSTITKVPANTGILLKGAAGNYAINTTTDDTDDVTGNVFIGVTEKTVVNKKGIFVLMNGGQGVGFYKTTAESFTVGANTAYIDALPEPEGEGARTFIGFDFDNTTTAIEGVATVKENNGEIYNLQGQRVMKAQKGLYIINGKKVMVK